MKCRAQAVVKDAADVGALPVLGFTVDDVCVGESGSHRTVHAGSQRSEAPYLLNIHSDCACNYW